MEHVRYYVGIEKTRFPDITVNFDLQSEDFQLPSLSVQPLVENAIKRGLMKLPQGGYSYSLDTRRVSCDYYDYLRTGHPEFRGEHMTQYSWADETCGLLWRGNQ